MTSVAEIKKEMKRASSAHQAGVAQWFFKTGPGEYGEGDQFIGIKVPILRKIAQQYHDLSVTDALTLLRSPIHEHRLVALFILIQYFSKADTVTQKKIFQQYLKHAQYINNWDLVDLSAPHIVGAYLADKPRAVLFRLAKSKLLWERRIAILATYTFIRQNDFSDTLQLATILKDDTEDLMRKAVGWMLREVGNRDLTREERWLKKYYKTIPRTMLRYAIEKFPEARRKQYLAGTL